MNGSETDTTSESNPFLTTALGVAEAAADALATLAPHPAARLGGQIASAIIRVATRIIERHGRAGAVEAIQMLERLSTAGPAGIHGATLAADDAALEREIAGWYAKTKS